MSSKAIDNEDPKQEDEKKSRETHESDDPKPDADLKVPEYIRCFASKRRIGDSSTDPNDND